MGQQIPEEVYNSRKQWFSLWLAAHSSLRFGNQEADSLTKLRAIHFQRALEALIFMLIHRLTTVGHTHTGKVANAIDIPMKYSDILHGNNKCEA